MASKGRVSAARDFLINPPGGVKEDIGVLSRLTPNGQWVLVAAEMLVTFTLIYLTIHFNTPKHIYLRFLVLIPVYHAGVMAGYSGGMTAGILCALFFLPLIPVDPASFEYHNATATAGVMLVFIIAFGITMGGAIGDSRKTRKYAAALSRGFTSIASETGGPEALKRMAREALSVIGADYAAVLYQNGGGDGPAWAITCTAGPEESDEIISAPSDSHILMRCAAGRKTFAANGPESDIRFNLGGKDFINNFIAAPALFEDKVYGAALIANKRGGDNFSEKDLSMLKTLAEAAGVVSHNIAQERERLEERGREERMKELFSRYVSSAVAQHVLDNPGLLKGRWQEVTVLVSDIRDFTSISEKMPAKKLVGQLNEYFTDMVDVIFDNEGTIDKFVGDCIIAYWGAPKPDPAHVLNAARAAAGMAEALETLNDKWLTEGKHAFRSGIALHTCNVLIGDVGDERKRAFTIMGDEVENAMRIEALTKNYGVSIIVSGKAADSLAASFALEKLPSAPESAAFGDLFSLKKAV